MRTPPERLHTHHFTVSQWPSLPPTPSHSGLVLRSSTPNLARGPPFSPLFCVGRDRAWPAKHISISLHTLIPPSTVVHMHTDTHPFRGLRPRLGRPFRSSPCLYLPSTYYVHVRERLSICVHNLSTAPPDDQPLAPLRACLIHIPATKPVSGPHSEQRPRARQKKSPGPPIPPCK